MASQMEDDTRDSPTPRNFSPWYLEFVQGIRSMVPKMSLPDESVLREKITNPEESEISDGELTNVTIQLEVLAIV